MFHIDFFSYSLSSLRTLTARLCNSDTRELIMRKSGLSLKVLTIPINYVGDGVPQDWWFSAIFDRVMGSIYLDCQKSISVVMSVLKRILESASMPNLIPPELFSLFGDAHPNVFFVDHCLKIGYDVKYQTIDQGIRAPISKRFRSTTTIHGVGVTEGYGQSTGASRLANLDQMRADLQLREYCIMLQNAFDRAHTRYHWIERANLPTHSIDYLTEFFKVERRDIDKWLVVLPLANDESVAPRGIRIVVPRVLSVLIHNSVMESISVGPSKNVANQTTLGRYSASLVRNIPMTSLVKHDYALLRPDILAAVACYYPYIPFPLEVIRPYLPSSVDPSSTVAPRATELATEDCDTSPQNLKVKRNKTNE